jgi:signal transduction histidine kinase
MGFNLITNIKSCVEFVNDVAPLSLVYYSHFVTIILSLLLGIYVFYVGRPSLTSRIFFGLTVFFSAYVVFDFVTWVSYDSTDYMFYWSCLGILASLVYISAIYFSYAFMKKKNIPFSYVVIFFILLLPVVVLTPTFLNLSGFSNFDCNAIEQVYFTNYYHSLGFVAFFWILILAISTSRKSKDSAFKSQILFMTLGIEALILMFLSATFLDTYLVLAGITSDYMFGNYGLFGMPIFIGFVVFNMVKFKTFNVRLFGAQALVFTLVAFLASRLFLNETGISRTITFVNLVVVCLTGYFLIKSVRKEISARERIETLADQLEHTNEKLRVLDQQKTQFVSLASHQLRAPLTAIKGYLSMILEGDYGPVEGETREMIERVETSANNLVTIVGDFLDVSRIEQGAMRYEWTDFDLKALVETVEHELKPGAENRGLVLSLEIEKDVEFKVHADMNKLKQVFTNLVDNSIKYTPKGEVKITLSRPKPTVVRFEIKDTGIGISEATLPKLFDKFVRAEGANDVNVIGTGLGLFVAKEMIKAHEGGKIWAESEGLGKGSRFVVELKGI